MSETQTEPTETPPEPPSAPDVPAPEPTPVEPAEGEREDEDEAEEEALESVEPTEPEPPSGLSPKEVEAIHKRLDSEADRHAKRVGEILGESSLDLVQCPLCLPNIPGFIYPVKPPEDVTAKVKEVLGEPVEPEYEKAANARACEGCKGYGKRLSGSKRPDQAVLNCSDCNGLGWIDVSGSGNVAATAATNGTTLPAPEVATEPVEATDPWGRKPTDEDYGVMPNLVATRHAVQGR